MAKPGGCLNVVCDIRPEVPVAQLTDGAAEVLREELTALRFPLDSAAVHRLRDHVCAYVDELRALGWPPERVVVALKHLAHEAGLHATATVRLGAARITDTDALIAEMVGWCVERYFFSED